MAPPELARDAPGMDVLHPVVVGLRPVAREDRDPSLAHRLDRRLGQRLDLHPPLLRHERLDDGLAAIADADRVAIGLDLLDQPERLHVLHDPLAALEAVQPGVAARLGRHLAVEADDGLDRQVVAAPDLEVDRIVARRHLDDAGTELGIDGVVRDDLHPDHAVDRGHLERLAHEVLVALVLGMHGQAGVAELRLRPHRAQGDRAVLDVDELVVALLALDLDVRENGLALRAPVDDAVVAVDQPFFPEPHERLPHRAHEPGVHREALARPVARGAETPELADDRAAGLFLPLPGAREVRRRGRAALSSCPRRRAAARRPRARRSPHGRSPAARGC